MMQIDPYSYMKKNMDYYIKDFYQSPQFGSVTTKMMDLFFDADGYFHNNSVSFPREKYMIKTNSRQKLVVDFFSPDGDFFKQLLLHHESQYYSQAIGVPQQQRNTFFSVIEAKSLYWQSLLGSFIDKLTQCQNYAQFSVVHNEYYRNPSNLYLVLLERYLDAGILGEAAGQGSGAYGTNLVLQSSRGLSQGHVVVPARTLVEYVRVKALVAAHSLAQRVDPSTCVCEQLEGAALQRQIWGNNDGIGDSFGPGSGAGASGGIGTGLLSSGGLAESQASPVGTCHIPSVRSMCLLVTQLVLKASAPGDPARDLAAFFLLLTAFNARHVRKTIVLYNILVAINMCHDSLVLLANHDIVNALVLRLLQHTKSQYTIPRIGKNFLTQIATSDRKALQMMHVLEKHAKNNTLLLLVADQVHTYLNARKQYVQVAYQKGQTPFLQHNAENYHNYTSILRIILKTNKIADVEHMKLKSNLDTVANSYQTLQTAVLSLITTSRDYDQNYILVLDTENMIQQILNNCDYTIKDIVAAIYGEDKAAKMGDDYHKKKLHQIILFNVIDTTYERLNELFGVKTKQEMIDQQLQTIKYYENLEKSGIDIKLKDWKSESEDMFVLKQILKSKQFIKMIGYGILFIYLLKHLLVWLMH